MKIYHASLNLKTMLRYKKLYPHKNLNVLRSFGMLDQEMSGFCKQHRNKLGSLIFDSGTWSLNNAKSDQSMRVNLTSYTDYLLSFGNLYDHYFNFDCVFSGDSDEINYQNQLFLENVGLNPVPVVHDVFGDEIDYYINKGYRMIALGSKQNRNPKVLEFAFDKLNSAKVKVHMFGHMDFGSVISFPIWSCDTTAWAQRGKWGFIYYWNPHRETLDKTDKIYMEEYLDEDKEFKFTYSTYEYRQDFDEYLYRELKIDSNDLYGPERSHVKCLANLHFYAKLEEIITQIHLKKKFDTD